MNQMRTLSISILLSVSLATGCKQSVPAGYSPNTTQAALAAGGKLNSDGSVTNANGSITMPNGTVVPAGTPAAAAATNQPPVNGAMTGPSVPPDSAAAMTGPAMTGPSMTGPATPPPPPPLVVPAGASITIRITQELAASKNEVGDHFTGVLERPIVVKGETVFPSGTPVGGEVTASKGKGRFKGAGDLGISLSAIGKRSVETSEYTLTNKGRGKRTAGFIGGGAGVGALIGGLAGGGKGALIGSLAGAGGGTAASAYTGSRDVIIRSESVITFRLRNSVTR